MALFVNTNVSSLNSQRNLSNATRSLDTSYQRLASGLRINSAKDDAAGLQISNRLTTQINGLTQGNRNAQDGISYAQTVEGAMDEMTTMYQRIRTLALQSANGTNSDKDRVAIQQEVTQLCAEINRITTDTTYGGTKILTGMQSGGTADAKNAGLVDEGFFRDASDVNMTNSKVDFQVGADARQTISVNLGYTAKKAGATVNTGFGITDLANGINANRKYDSSDPKYKADGTNAMKISAAATAAQGTPGDAGYVAPKAAVVGTFLVAKDEDGNDMLAFDVSSADSAQNVIENIDSFIAAVDSKRAELGAVENRLESTIRNQSNINENISDARSRIRDTDFATETANMTQTNILQQAAQSILSQANQRPQIALSLLQQ